MSGFLFAEPCFLCGMARSLDLGAQLDSYNHTLSPAQADQLALFSDWTMVANDMWAAFDQYEDEHPEIEQQECKRAKEAAV